MEIKEIYNYFLQTTSIATDNRKIKTDNLFVALKGDNFNGNKFALSALENGAKYAIIDEAEFKIDDRFILVDDSLLALQQLASYHRNQLNITIIGLTGSNGKTTTKELINAVLSQKFNTKATIGNLNNHIGVPLTLLSFDSSTEIGIVEMGANHQKEIEMLCGICQPDFGYITNFGKAHLEGFGGVEGVIKGKSEMYQYLIENKQIILVNENDPIQAVKTEHYTPKITFGKESSDFQFEEFSAHNLVGLSFKGINAQSHLTGNYNFTNLCAAASLGLHFEIDFEDIKKAIESYIPTNMRSQILNKDGKVFVLDTYNANPSSMAESLKNFSTFEGSKTIIIGDMLELGADSEMEHHAILNLAQTLHFDEIITVGSQFAKVNQICKSFENSAALSTYLKDHAISSENILLKGSRGIALEQILDFIH